MWLKQSKWQDQVGDDVKEVVMHTSAGDYGMWDVQESATENIPALNCIGILCSQ